VLRRIGAGGTSLGGRRSGVDDGDDGIDWAGRIWNDRRRPRDHGDIQHRNGRRERSDRRDRRRCGRSRLQR